MSILRIENGPLKGLEKSLPTDGVLVVGSDPQTAHFILVDDLVARAHFSIAPLKRGNGFYLQDLGSARGTIVNGKNVQSSRLQTGDQIQVGQTTLTFLPSAKTADRWIGRTLCGYRFAEKIGAGGMGVVYRATQLSLNRVVAIKILAPRWSQDAAFVERFLQEARAAAILNHPNVAHIYDAGTIEDTYFYAMEFMDLGTLENLIKECGKLSVQQALRITRDIALGLHYAAQKNIVHGDIKPENIMLCSAGVAKIADLGLADSHKKQNAIIGTPHFIAPEQIRGEVLDARTDLYSLGASLFRMLTGKTPFQGQSVREILQKHLKEESPRVKDFTPDIPAFVDQLIEKLMQKNKQQRFASAAEFIATMDQMLNHKPVAAKPWLLAGAGALALLAVGIFWLQGNPTITQKTIMELAENSLPVQENHLLHQQLIEQQAQTAYWALPTNVLPEQKLAQLDSLAQEFQNTHFGKRAQHEAQQLRGQIAATKTVQEDPPITVAQLSPAPAVYEKTISEQDQPLIPIPQAADAVYQTQDLQLVYQALFHQANLAHDLQTADFVHALTQFQNLRQQSQSKSYQAYLSQWQTTLSSMAALQQKLASMPGLQNRENPIELWRQNQDAWHTKDKLALCQWILLNGIAQQALELKNQGAAMTESVLNLEFLRSCGQILASLPQADTDVQQMLARVQAEEKAAIALNHALRAFAAKDYPQAQRSFTHLRDHYSHTFLFSMFSDGSTHLTKL